MKKGLFTHLTMIVAALFSVNLAAQTFSRVKIPVKHDAPPKSLQWSYRKPPPPSSTNGFKTPIPVLTASGHLLNKLLTKSVGDGTTLNGNVVAANNWTEENTHYGIYSLDAKADFELTPVKENAELNSTMAVYVKGKYYTFDFQEIFGMLLELSCTVYDAETWEIVHTYSNEQTWNNVPVSSALTYDAVTDQVYAVTYNADLSGCDLSIMNQENGSFTRVSGLSRTFITLAATPDGTLYALADDGVLYSLDKNTGKEQRVGNTGLSPKYSQATTCDPVTGKLYWAFLNDQETALYEINTSTGTAYKIGDMPHGEEMAGLFIQSPEFPQTAPAPVTDLRFTPGLAGSLNGTISCIAPARNLKGDDLSGTLKVTLYSGNDKISVQEVTPGKTVELKNYTFKANELYTLYAIASNSVGSGPKQSITVYVGKDAASAPAGVTLSINDKQGNLSWTAPTTGLNDGYVDPAQISYKIVRHAGDDQGTFIHTTKAGITSYTDQIPAITANYSYAVTALYNNQEGGTALSNRVLSVGAYELPFYDDFSDGELSRILYTFIDVDQDGHDNQSRWFWKEDEKLMQFCADNQHVGNDWLITPGIHLDGKNMYNLGFNMNMGAPSNLRVTIGTSPDPKNHSTVLDLNNINEGNKTSHTTQVKVPEDGIYYLGFYAYSGLESYYLNLFDISLDKGMSTGVPDSVYHFKVVPGEKGQTSAKLSFNAPETLINGQAIPGSLKIKAYRNEKLMKEFPVTPGEAVEWTDENPGTGNTVYRLVPVLDEQAGLASSQTVWIGFDISEPVKDLTVKTVDHNMHVQLAWKAPGKGINGAWFDPNAVTYSVWRSYDGDNFSPIADNIKSLTYTDIQIEEELAGRQDSYFYAVTADTKGGVSTAVTQIIAIGTPYNIPEWESFPDGKFHITPWTTESVEGSFSWECMKKDAKAGVYPQDKDNGFIKFNSYWGGNTVSRLKTPVFDLTGSKNPSFSFFMFHWKAGDVEADGKKTKIALEISVDGGDFEQIGESITAAYDQEGWIEHRISLSEYKNARQVQFGLTGSTDNSWMYYYVDNIRIEEQEEYDLAVSGFDGTENATTNEEGNYTLTYFNRGTKTASGYTLDLYQDDQPVQSLKGEEIRPGESKTIDMKTVLNAAKAGKECTFYARIVYDKDANTNNNQSTPVNTSVKGTWYPVVEDLRGKSNGNRISLSWTAPVIPAEITETTDGAEGYEPFIIDNIGNWITYDGDERGCGYQTNLPEYPNRGVNQAFQVWVPGDLDGVTAEKFPELQPRTGEQCFISWYANTNIDGQAAYNDDYLISPEVMGGTKVRFYIHRISEQTTGEYYQIMYSATTRNPEDFQVLQEGEAGFEWEKAEATLPADARYFAIHYTAKDCMGILVDDISYTSAIFALKIKGFNVFRDEQKLNDALLTTPAFVDPDLTDDKYAYQVSVVYDRGESDASRAIEILTGVGIEEAKTAVQVYTGNGRIVVLTENTQPVVVYTIDGKQVGASTVNGKEYFSVEKGIYLIKVGKKVAKVAVNN